MIIAFVLGLLFSYFCYEVFNEQVEVIEYNQPHEDKTRKQYGIRYEMWDSALLALGCDWQWWIVPTHPELKTNYFESTWSRRELRNPEVSKEEDDSDPDKK